MAKKRVIKKPTTKAVVIAKGKKAITVIKSEWKKLTPEQKRAVIQLLIRTLI